SVGLVPGINSWSAVMNVNSMMNLFIPGSGAPAPPPVPTTVNGVPMPLAAGTQAPNHPHHHHATTQDGAAAAAAAAQAVGDAGDIADMNFEAASALVDIARISGAGEGV
ncbi:hypothetical protein HK097_003035, partial [Rhizophlyctis rosea]